MTHRNFCRAAALTGTMLCSSLALAGNSSTEIARLGHDLTPFGAEAAGNKDGSIPAWTGGLTKALVPASNDLPADQYPAEKPLFVIDQSNIAKYADKLSDGQKALIAKYADYKIEVYPSHRSFAAPQFAYANAIKNAASGEVTDGGQSVKGVYGGTPFPLPKSGIELYWNHTLRLGPTSNRYDVRNMIGNADGTTTLAVQATDNRQTGYYLPNGTLDSWNGDYTYGRLQNTGPAFKAGEMLVIRDNISAENPRQAWQYLVGQRRVRRAPTVGHDTPDFVASGSNYFDEVFGFWGDPSRYDWKLVGKKELFVPYNENRFFQTPLKDALAANHLNSHTVRWELHRVWEVELSLAPGKRHVVPKRRAYFDEDSYAILLLDGYDAEGKLWRTSHMLPEDIADNGYIFFNATVVYNLQAGTYSGVELLNEGSYKDVPLRPSNYFTGDALAAEGVR